jgi:hypothetical protein
MIEPLVSIFFMIAIVNFMIGHRIIFFIDKTLNLTSTNEQISCLRLFYDWVSLLNMSRTTF